MSNLAHIYKIENTVNGNCYIGSSVNYKARWYTHKSSLRRGVHHSFILQKAWDKYGEDKFVFKVILICSKSTQLFYETLCMPFQAYNLQRTPRQVLFRGGWKHTEEFKNLQSERGKLKGISKACMAASILARKGVKTSIEFKEKCRARQLGVAISSTTKTKLSVSLKKHWGEDVIKRNLIVKEIYNEYNNSDTIGKLCKKYNISTATFYTGLKDLGLPPIKSFYTSKLLDKINANMLLGNSFHKACLELGLAPETMRTIKNRRVI